MSGPVWRFESSREGVCDACLHPRQGLFVEGEVRDNRLEPARRVCPDCMAAHGALLVRGELGARTPSPAYADR